MFWQYLKIAVLNTSYFEKNMEICFITASYLSWICLIFTSYMKHRWLWWRLNDTVFNTTDMCGGRGVGRGEGGWCVNNRMFVPPPGHWGHSADLAGVIAHSAHWSPSALPQCTQYTVMLLPLQFLCPDSWHCDTVCCVAVYIVNCRYSDNLSASCLEMSVMTLMIYWGVVRSPWTVMMVA